MSIGNRRIIMRERSYLLDKSKTNGLKASVVCKDLDAERRTVWAWLKGVNPIPESKFAVLLRVTEKMPSDLLTEESMEFISNLSI